MQRYSAIACKKIISLLLGLLINISINAEILSPMIEFTAPHNVANGPHEPYTPLAYLNNNIYLVYLDANNRPLVTQKSCDRTLATVPLDSNPDYTAFPDGHHRFSAGVDKNGYVHITGDMHAYPTTPPNYLPLRYQNQQIMYWVSNAPNDITKGFTFAGGLNASTAIPGLFWNTGHFFNDNNNELYYTSMVRGVYNVGVRLTGEMAVGLYKYNVSTRSWTALGNFPPKDPSHPAGTQYFKVLYWEKSGWSSPAGQAQWFNNYWPSLQFDNQNTLHFSLSVNTDITVQGPSRVVYAKSFDSGVTWRKANGSFIGLPLRGIDGNANLADVVADFGKNVINVSSHVAADNNGNPLVNVEISWQYPPNWYHFDGSKWIYNDISNSRQFAGNIALLARDGKISINAVDRIAIRRIASLTQSSSIYFIDKYLPSNQLSSFVCLCGQGLKANGNIYGLGLSDNLKNIQVIKLNFAPQGLPCGWSYLDIGSNIKFGGASDYLNGTFTLRTGGTGIKTATNDSFSYTYKTLSGNGTIIARVTGFDNILNIHGSSSGVMLRQSLTNYTKSVYVGINVDSNAEFIYRNELNAVPQVYVSATTVPQWVKIVRAGNLFSGFISADGMNWTPIGKPQTIIMENTIYVGLANYANHDNDIFMSTMDNVSIVSGVNS